MRRRAAAWMVAALAGVPAGAWADVIALQDSRQQYKLANGVQAVVTITKARSASSLQDAFHLTFYRGAQRLAEYPGLDFTDWAVSPDGKLIVALSNSGIPVSAVAIFTSEGVLRLVASHHDTDFNYCAQSISVLREWYDPQRPNVQFDKERGVAGISLRDCRGQQRPLLQILAEANQRRLDLERTLKEFPVMPVKPMTGASMPHGQK